LVFSAIDSFSSKPVVVKVAVVFPELEQMEFSALQQMRNEHRLLVGPLAGCPGTPEIVHFQQRKEDLVLVETPLGTPLPEYLEQVPLPERKELLIRCGLEVATYLHEFERRGVVHCDIRPENLVVTADGAVTIIDYGMSAKRSEILEWSPRGTKEYADPKILGGGLPSLSTDLTSLYLTLHALEVGLQTWYREAHSSRASLRFPSGSAAGIVQARVSKCYKCHVCHHPWKTSVVNLGCWGVFGAFLAAVLSLYLSLELTKKQTVVKYIVWYIE
jgi:serine/threonine protein kinase